MEITPVSRDRRAIKMGVLGILMLFAAYFFGWALYTVIPGGPGGHMGLLLTFLLLWISFGVIAVLVAPRSIAYPLFGTSALLMYIGARPSVNAITMLGLLLALAWFSAAYAKSSRESENTIRPHIAHNALRTSQSLITGISFLIAFLFIAHVQANGFTLPEDGVQGTLGGAEPIVAIAIPSFSLKTSLHDVVEGMVRKKLGPDASDALVEDNVQTILHTAEESLGMPVDGEEETGHFIYEVLSDRLHGLSPSAQNAALAGLGVLVFIIAKGLGLFFSYATAGFSFMLYHVALAFGFLHRESVEVRKESIVL